VEFTHNGETHAPGDTFEIDDATLELMTRYGHRFEGIGHEAGVPLVGYAIEQRGPTAPSLGNQPGAGAVRGQTAKDLLGRPEQGPVAEGPVTQNDPNQQGRAETAPAPNVATGPAVPQTTGGQRPAAQSPAAAQPQPPANNTNAPSQG